MRINFAKPEKNYHCFHTVWLSTQKINYKPFAPERVQQGGHKQDQFTKIIVFWTPGIVIYKQL